MIVAAKFGTVIGKVTFWINKHSDENYLYKEYVIFKLGKLYDRREIDVHHTNKKFAKEI